MPITEVKAYRVGEQVFPTIQEAQKEELATLLEPSFPGVNEEQIAKICEAIVGNTDEIVAILTCQPKSKKPRSDKGRSHRKATPDAPAAP